MGRCCRLARPVYPKHWFTRCVMVSHHRVRMEHIRSNSTSEPGGNSIALELLALVRFGFYLFLKQITVPDRGASLSSADQRDRCRARRAGPALRSGIAGPARGRGRIDPQRRKDHFAACRFRSRFRATVHRHPRSDRRGTRQRFEDCSTALRRLKRPLPAWSARTQRSSRSSARRSTSAKRWRRNSRWRCRPSRAAPRSGSKRKRKSESAAAAASHPFAGLMRLVDREGGKR